MQAMQRLEGRMRKAIQEYDMIQANDRICVGVSGGKDSVALVVGLNNLSRYHKPSFEIHALILDPCFDGIQTDFTPLLEFLESQNIPCTVQRTNIARMVFETRKESNPCALCALARRGALHDGALRLGCNKVALGHHLDDAIETFFMNLFGEGRIGCFSPKSWLSRKDITVIRPLILAEEQAVIRATTEFPIVKSLCPVDGHTTRASAKKFVHQQAVNDPSFRQKMLGAIQKAGIDGWNPGQERTF